MLNLVIKDYQIVKRDILLNLAIILIVFSALTAVKDFNYFMIYFFMVILTMNFVSNVFSVEEKNHSEVFVLSLPVSRSSLVRSRYMSVMGVTLFAGLCAALASYTSFAVMSQVQLSLESMFFFGSLTVMVNSLFSSVLIPMMYRFGFTRANSYNRLMMAMMILVPVTVKLIGEEGILKHSIIYLVEILKGFSELQLGGIAFLIAALATGISMTISQKIYKI